ncbi:hypothetical protein EYF80_040837 [Liparis tanakae]|uniref:Uncharacterized protein n=1 Tax=Liparis tanakae TaxID=230148 RepID=A0A4Z2G5U3_9TELE|nr:hypothetical protein EYF80_040837 [Liparis tanakae]
MDETTNPPGQPRLRTHGFTSSVTPSYLPVHGCILIPGVDRWLSSRCARIPGVPTIWRVGVLTQTSSRGERGAEPSVWAEGRVTPLLGSLELGKSQGDKLRPLKARMKRMTLMLEMRETSDWLLIGLCGKKHT